MDGLVLGGIEGVKKRLESSDVNARIAAVREALKYGDEGIDVIINTLEDSSRFVQNAAAKALKQNGGLRGKEAILKCDPYLYFSFVDRGEFNLERFSTLEEFANLLTDSQASEIEALYCGLGSEGQYLFGQYLEAICDAKDQLPNLKALFIGDDAQRQFRESYLDVFDIRPFLEAYPKLEVLQVSGSFFVYPLECEGFRHENLKTLIIETVDLSNYNLTQICNLDLPMLEYLEIWLGIKIYSIDNELDSLFLGKSFPNLKYLGLKSAGPADIIAEKIINSSLLDRLLILDLSMGCLTDEGANLLRNFPKIEKLHTLDISENYGYSYEDGGQKYYCCDKGSDRYSALYESLYE
ncbi:HEAT repeat domain-containing protein [Crocosphaera chwakensis]|uniref:HEAT repeat domain-containing protein n=1 Tax=Crocosphaera chwakensis TaxID=2546361 RepID=UPI0018DCB409|nr:HEAT repeat domain-containing protein [Crocosphaera chwakensis]